MNNIVAPLKSKLYRTFKKMSGIIFINNVKNCGSADIWQHWDYFLSFHTRRYVNCSKHYETRCLLKRFELYEQATHRFFPLEKKFSLSIDSANGALIEAVWNYARYESQYQVLNPKLFSNIMVRSGQSIRICKRSDNTATQYVKHFRAFLNWCMNTGRTNNREFREYEIRGERYRSPFYLTISERNVIRNHKFNNSSVSQVRDIFLFQCLTGERYSDLARFTNENIVQTDYVDKCGNRREVTVLSYIAQKTSREGDARTIIVPLERDALALIEKYKNVDSKDRLFPVPSLTYYNLIIKRIIKECGINRQIEILDKDSGNLITVPLYEVAGSHIARRTCIGGLFKQGVNRDVIASISGHTKGSRAIARYYEVDTMQKVDAIRALQG